MIIIDGDTYNLKIASFVAGHKFSEKYRLFDGAGNEHRELRGVYDVFEIEFGPSLENSSEYERLIAKLRETADWHTFSFPTVLGAYEVTGSISDIEYAVLVQDGNNTYWSGFSVVIQSREKRPT